MGFLRGIAALKITSIPIDRSPANLRLISSMIMVSILVIACALPKLPGFGVGVHQHRIGTFFSESMGEATQCKKGRQLREMGCS